MIEWTIFIYMISWVVMELVWLKTESRCFLEDFCAPCNWRTEYDIFTHSLVLITLPIIMILRMGFLFYDHTDRTTKILLIGILLSGLANIFLLYDGITFLCCS